MEHSGPGLFWLFGIFTKCLLAPFGVAFLLLLSVCFILPRALGAHPLSTLLFEACPVFCVSYFPLILPSTQTREVPWFPLGFVGNMSPIYIFSERKAVMDDFPRGCRETKFYGCF